MGNMMTKEANLIGDAPRCIAELLTDSWNLVVDSQEAPRQADAVINLTGPDGFAALAIDLLAAL